jgi:hypothetical protein
MDKKYKVDFEVTIAQRGSMMSCKTGDMNIDTDATLEELKAMPDFDQVVGQMLQRDHPKLRIVMVKVIGIKPLG